ncbi:MAG: J domain-containing protein [Spirochaetaceae bacterium]|nr:J domain-containing protein [Spirochaetaceae bacterium]
MKNYYELFGLKQSCSLEEIKNSFREKVKRLHPDVSREADAGERFRILLAAYRTLTDPDKRADYDMRMPASRAGARFVYRDFLKERTGDAVSQAKLIFYDLLHDNEEEALELYERLLLRPEFSLELFMDREDFMDCAFMLAEEYERGGMYRKAFNLFVELVRCERQKPYFRHFLEEVLSRMRVLANTRLAKALPPRELPGQYFPLLELGLSARETVFYTKKIAEAYRALGRDDLAGDYVERCSAGISAGNHRRVLPARDTPARCGTKKQKLAVR